VCFLCLLKLFLHREMRRIFFWLVCRVTCLVSCLSFMYRFGGEGMLDVSEEFEVFVGRFVMAG